MIFGIAEITTVSQATYPPYGLPNVSFVGLAAFLILVGLHHSAIFAAPNMRPSRLIKNSAIKEAKLLGSMGSAQMTQELQNKIVSVTKENAQLMGRKKWDRSFSYR